MWALSTCGARPPNEIKKNIHPRNITALCSSLHGGHDLLDRRVRLRGRVVHPAPVGKQPQLSDSIPPIGVLLAAAAAVAAAAVVVVVVLVVVLLAVRSFKPNANVGGGVGGGVGWWYWWYLWCWQER